LPPRGERSREYAARVSGAGARTVQDAATVREADPTLFAAIKAGTLPAHRAAQRVRRERRYAEIGPAPPLPRGLFDVVYADPPWQLGNPEADYAPENYYPTLSLDEIKELAVPAAENACLFLWAVNGLLPEAIEVIGAWGFSYKTNFCWDKGSIGLGVWARYRHELLLFAVRGNVSPPETRNRCESLIESKRGRHSEKPACVYGLIERMHPQTTKLELFCRGAARSGWTAWGNEVTE
jgi:N6-adenosine-specific RNA methylase IME4